METRNVRWALFLLLGTLVLSLAACGPGGSANPEPTGGTVIIDDGGTPTPTGNLTGSVFNDIGKPLSGASVTVFSKPATGTTGEDGQYGVTVTYTPHGMIFQGPSSTFGDVFRFVDLTTNRSIQVPVILNRTSVAPADRSALSAFTVKSNVINGYSATLAVPAQASGNFELSDLTKDMPATRIVSRTDFSLELADLSRPLPFPLPDAGNRSYNVTTGVGRQAPMAVVTVRPVLLRNLSTLATLVLPNAGYLTPVNQVRVVHFSPERHMWEDTGYTLDVASTAGMPIVEGGLYGVFAEQDHTAWVQGTIDAPAGSLVFIGDQVDKIEASGEEVTFKNVHVPYDGSPVKVVVVDPATGSKKETSITLTYPQQGFASIPPITGAVGSVTLTALIPSANVGGGAGGQVSIRATVTDPSGDPVSDGTLVNFYVDGGFSDSVTTSNGIADFSLTSGTTPTTVTIRATAGGVGSNEVNASFVPGPIAKIVLAPTPSTMNADGQSTITFKATAQDVYGNYVADGRTINFSATGPDNLPAGVLAPASKTTANGVAETVFTATTEPGRYTVVARGGVNNVTSNEAYVTLLSSPVSSVNLTVGGTVVVANGLPDTTLTAEVLDSNGNPVPDNTPVTFSTTAGSFGGLTRTTVMTGRGIATAKLTSPTRLGTGTVKAEAGGIQSSVDLTFVAGPVTRVAISIKPTSLLADGGSTSAITVMVEDAFGNPVVNENVHFEAQSGSILPVNKTTDPDGRVEAVYTASTGSGQHQIKASATNGVFGTAVITLVPVQAGSISVTTAKSEVVADGKSSTVITAVVMDGAGNPLLDGTVVTFANSTPYGTLSPTTATTLGGRAAVVLTSPTKASQIAVITGSAQGLSGSTIVQFIPGPPHRIQAVANPQSIPATFAICPGDEARILATVVDANGNPVTDGTEVTFALDKGWIWDEYPDCQPPIKVVTYKTVATGNGVSKIAVFGDEVVQTATVDICSGGLCYTDQAGDRGLKIFFGSSLGEGEGLPAYIEVEVAPSILQIKGFGNQKAIITARVYDGNGNPISDNYEGGDGATQAGSNVFTATGANFLRRGFDAGDTLEITAGADNGLYTVTAVTESTLTLSGTMSATAANLTYRATIKGNITFDIILGPGGGETLDDLPVGQPAVKSTKDGVATAALISGNLPGTVNVRMDCRMYNKQATAISPEIGIQSGPPAQISFGPSGTEISNGDGTNTRYFYAIVQDKFGNPVPNGTAVAFGLVDNANQGAGLGYKTAGNNASGTAGLYTVSAPGALFLTRGVKAGDTLIITETASQLRGGYIIKSVDSEDQVTLYKKLSFSGADLDFIAGSSEFGVVTGTGQTGNTGTPGVVITTVTYPRLTAGNRPVTLYAATSAFDLDLNPYNLGTTWTGVYSGSHGVGEVTLTAGKDEIIANGADQTRLDVTVLDVSGNPTPDGTSVTFETTAGTLSAASASTVNGQATVYLTGTTSLGQATITASAEGVSAKVTVKFVAGPVKGPMKLFVQPGNLVADGTSTSLITVIAADDKGNPVAGESIRFSVDEGTILPVVASTDSNGIATAVYTAASVEGSYTITARAANGETGTGRITLIGIPIGSVTVTARSNELVADGLSNTLITATVLDGTGRPVDGVEVTFTNSTQYGTLSASTATTLGGAASVVLTAPTQAAKLAVIRAEAGGLVGSTIVHFIPGPPHRIVAVANPQTVPAHFVNCPGDSSRILATVLDINDNPVTDGTAVTFSLDKGWIWDTYPDCQPPIPVVNYKTIETGNGTAKIAVFGDEVVQTATVDICTGGLCYEDASGSRGLKIKFGSSVGPASGLPAYLELTVSTNTLQVRGTGARQTATITASVFDETGNPIEDSYAAGDGQTTAGSNVFTSTSANWQTRGFKAGDQIIVNSGGDNGTYAIQSVVSESQVTLSSNMGYTNTDLSFTAKVENNIRFTILLGPGGGETLDGQPSTSLKSTVNGQATASLLTGILPGTVTILVEATQGGHTATAVSPEIGIQAGPPAVINLAPTGQETSNLDGTNTRTYFVTVMDRFGNPVPDGTAVYFGLVDNQNQGLGNGYKTAGSDASIFGGYTVTSASAQFVTNGVVPGDTLIITEAGNKAQGGYLVKTVDSETQVTLYKQLPASGAGLSFVAGSAELGLIGGVAQTGNDGNPGVCTTFVTYPRFAAGNKPVTIYASTSGFDLNLNPYNLGTTWSGIYGATQSVGEVLVTLGGDEVVADGLTSTRVDAAVSDVSGLPVPDGTPVVFTATAGTLSLTETVTQDGVASVFLKSPTGVGTATVTALVAGISGSATLDFIPGPPANIGITASPANLTADGSSLSFIRVVVTDAQGNAVSDEEKVNFSLQAGSGRLLTLSAPVAGGIAQTTYVAGTVPGTDTIRARTTNGREASVDVTLVGSSVGSVAVTTGSASIVADGASAALITARVLDANQSPVPDGTLVTFATTAGTVNAYTSVTPGVATTMTAPTVNGNARVLLYSSERVGQAGVTATVGGVSGSTSVQFIPGAVSNLLLSANPANLSADGASLSVIRAVVTDPKGNAVDGETISFTIVSGGGRLLAATDVTVNGAADVSYEAGGSAGTVTIRASSTNGITQTTTITLVSAIVSSVNLGVGATSIVADGTSSVLLTAQVLDSAGGPVADGTLVTFSTTAGTVNAYTATLPGAQASFAAPTVGGVAQALLFSTRTVGTAQVTATVGGISDSGQVSFVPGPVNSVNLAASPVNLTADGTSQATLRAEARDEFGNAVNDFETISFAIISGTGLIQPSTDFTQNGIAAATYTSGTTPGTVTVRASSTNGFTATTTITLVQAQVGQVDLTAGGSSIPADGVSHVAVTAVVKTDAGAPVPEGTLVTFHTTAGSVAPYTAAASGGLTTLNAPTVNGVARVMLFSSELVGQARVTATVGGILDEVTVKFEAGAPARVVLTSEKAFLPADNGSTMELYAQVTDAMGNAVADGESVSFTVVSGGGRILAPAVFTVDGLATTTYKAGNIAGVVNLRAETTNRKFGTTAITLLPTTIASVDVTAEAAQIPVGGGTPALIRAVVADSSGNPVPDGTSVTFDTTAGLLGAYTAVAGASASLDANTVNGEARILLFSGDTVGNAKVYASAGGVVDFATVDFVTGTVARVTVTMNPANLPADSTSTSNVVVQVQDAFGNPVANESVSLLVDMGTIAQSTPQTNLNGFVFATYTAGATFGDYSLAAKAANGVTGEVHFFLIGEEVGAVNVETGQTELVADGASNTQVLATVYDANGHLVPDGTPVTFINQTVYGALSATSANTVNGRASVVLTAPTKAGTTAMIRADSGGFSGNAVVTFIPGPAYRILVTGHYTSLPEAYTLCPDSTGKVVATVVDAFGNPIADGTQIEFALDRGWIWNDFPLCPDPPTKPITVVSSKSVPAANGSAAVGIVGGGFVEVGRVSICAGGICYQDENGVPGLEVSFGGTAGDALGLPAVIQLENLSDAIQVLGTGGQQNAVIRAKVLSAMGNPIQDSYQAGDGATAVGSNVFTSASAQFQTRGFNAGDKLEIWSGADHGIYAITGVLSETQVTLGSNLTEAHSQDLYFTARIQDNITFTILTGPGGGENLEGAQTIVKSTVDGEASITLNAGRLPGVVTVMVTATQGAGNASSINTGIIISSGPPAMISIYSGDTEQSVGNGINVRTLNAFLVDKFGNPVPKGTVVYFGLVDHIKTSGADGQEVLPSSFLSASAGFLTHGVLPDDTVVVTGGTPYNIGGFPIETVNSNTQVTLARTLFDAGAGLSYIVGDALYGSVDSQGTTGADNLPGVASAGIGYSRLTAGNKQMVFHAMTVGIIDAQGATHNLGATFTSTYALSTSVGNVAMNIGVTSLVADETDSTPISVQVLDSSFAPVPDGTAVTFRTSAGALSAYTATTVQGFAQVTLTSGRTVGSATVTAIAGGVSAQGTVQFVAGAVDDVLLVAQPANLSADGVSTSLIRATAVDAFGNRVSGEPLSFTVVSGTLAGASATTDVNGEATMIYTAPGQVPGGGVSGTDSVGVRSTNGKARAVTIALNAASVGTVSITSGSTSIVADAAHTSQIFARVFNAGGGLVQDGTLVTFSTTAGTVTPYTATVPGAVRTISVPTINGEATVSLWSSIYVGTASVSATAGGRTASTTVNFIPGEPAELRLMANPASLHADGQSTSVITVTVRDQYGNPVADGEIINFRVTLGRLSALTSATTGGIATVTYTAPATGESDTITATATNGVSADPVNIVLIGPAIANIVLTTDASSLPANGTSWTTVYATVSLEGGGNAPDGTQVLFSIKDAGGGTIDASALLANGVAKVKLTSGIVPETITIVAEAGSAVAELPFSYKSGDVRVEIVPNSILATGVETAQVRVYVTSSSGAPQANSPVTFTLSNESMGTLSLRTAVTNGLGYTEVTFTGGTSGGEVRITATWIGGVGDTVTGMATLQIQPPPAFISVAANSPAPPAINVRGTGGVSTSTLTFDVKDGQNQDQQVADGYRIDFEILDGPSGGEAIVPLYAYTKNGQVSTIMKSGFRSGPVTVKASYFNDRNVNAVASLVINAGPPVGEEFSIFPAFRNMSGLSYSNLDDTVHVNVGDVYGDAIPDGTAIWFNTNNTGGLFAQGSDQSLNGSASDILRTTTGPDPIQGFVSVNAEANNGGRTTHVASLAIIPGSDVMYAATNGGGVYKSLDAGASWFNQSASQVVVAQNWIDPYVNAVAVDPDDPNRVFAGTGYAGSGSVFRSFDGGERWNSDNDEEITGMFSVSGAVYSLLVDGDGNSDPADGEYLWIGTQGNGLIYTDDFSLTPSWDMTFNSPVTAEMGVGRTVFDIAKSPSPNGGDGAPPNSGANAILYAATPRGVYRSGDGAANWAALPAFVGNNISTLEVYNDAGIGDVVYAGTVDAGVWVYAGGAWTSYPAGMGKAVRATDPVLSRESTGNGYIANLNVRDNALSETWVMKCISQAANSGTFALTGTVSGFQGNYIVADKNGPLNAVGSLIEFRLVDGEVDFKVGDTFTFKTVRDLGKNIQDLAVDMSRRKLYAITYFWGPLEAHAIGDLYVHDLNADGTMAVGNWTKVNTNLPQYEPPDDKSLFAQHVLEFDNPAAPKAMFLGGEGIHLYKAEDVSIGGLSDFAANNIQWHDSEMGLNNKIITRTPVVFTGPVTVKVYRVSKVANPIRVGAWDWTLELLVEDRYGNPPIVGSKLEMTNYRLAQPPASGFITAGTNTLKEWGDVIHTNGTYRDGPENFSFTTHGYPAGQELYDPITVSFTVGPAYNAGGFYDPVTDQKVKLEFTPGKYDNGAIIPTIVSPGYSAGEWSKEWDENTP